MCHHLKKSVFYLIFGPCIASILKNPGKFLGSRVLAMGRSGYWKRRIFFFPPYIFSAAPPPPFYNIVLDSPLLPYFLIFSGAPLPYAFKWNSPSILMYRVRMTELAQNHTKKSNSYHTYYHSQPGLKITE